MGSNPKDNPITNEWYSKADAYHPKAGRDYGWVWDYSKFRLQLACGNQRYIEEKVITAFKLLLVILAGYGTVFSYFVSQKVILSVPSYLCGIGSVIVLIVAAVLMWHGFNPLDHLYPIKEEAALVCIDDHNSDQDCRANMSLAMTASIEVERRAIDEKAKWLKRGCVTLGVSVLLFTFAICFQMSP
jgi:hypothetical protein